MSTLKLDHVTKAFDDGSEDIIAVDDLSMTIDDGEFLVLVGPSGCGKSTTLRMLAGLETITAGEIHLGDRVINDVKPKDRDVAMVFQSYALYPHMTVRENMNFGLEESTTLSDEEIRPLVTETAEMLGIDELLDRTPDELSGGQQQRVALGRAIVRDPEVFLMDEPLSNLDAKLRSDMRTELQQLQGELGTTTVYVTHDQTEAMTMGDRIAILNDGVLQQVATPLEAYHRPANRFVAGFIGDPSMNFFEMTVQDDRLVTEQFTYPLTRKLRDAVDDVSQVTFGVRPESIELTQATAAIDHESVEFIAEVSDEHSFETIVDVVEPMGNENTIHLSFSGADDATFVATIDGERELTPGQTVVAHIPESEIHLFDGETGLAVHNRLRDESEATESTM
ncbi:ABC transporter ATP-binding protein [Halocatena halophila]|uniref:ABC transporter ATP-binding protein n=1 Tax=Halocatena halophila TaxID=2814576 RepID=UPI002ED682E8